MATNSREQKELLSIISRLDQARVRRAEAAGALQQVQSQLKSRFGCTSLKDAKEKLRQLGEEIEKEQNRFAKGLASLYKDVEGLGI